MDVNKLLLEEEISRFYRKEKKVPNKDILTELCRKNYLENAEMKRLVSGKTIDIIIQEIVSKRNVFNYFSDFVEKEESFIDRQKNGVVFTPDILVKYIADKAITYWKTENPDKTLSKICDISSGMGAFLNYLDEKAERQVQLIGVDKKDLYIQLSEIYFFSHRIELLCGDSLFQYTDQLADCDMVIGNPPYVRYQNIDKEYADKIRKKYFRVADGNFDLSAPFLYRSLELVKEGGIVALILTNKIMDSDYGRKLRSVIENEYCLLEVVDFRDAQLFADKTTYTCILFIKKSKNKKDSVVVTRFKRNKDKKNILRLLQSASSYRVLTDEFYGSRWNLEGKMEQEILRKITGLERDFIRKYIRGDDIKGGCIEKYKQIIWPYKEQGNQLLLADEQDLKKSAPHVYDILCANKDKLAHESKTTWYAYLRPQNMEIQSIPKILSKEMMPVADFAFDEKGEYCFGSGYAILPEGNMGAGQLKVWCHILNTPVMEFQLRLCGTVLHSGWFRMLKRHFQELYLPAVTESEMVDLQNRLEDGSKQENKIYFNDYVAGKFKLSDKNKRDIMSYLIDFHLESRAEQVKVDSIIMDGMKLEEKEIYKTKFMHTDKRKDSLYTDLSDKERELYYPVELTQYNKLHVIDESYRNLVTFKESKKLPVYSWYSYTQGFSEALVYRLLEELQYDGKGIIFDPFCGSGTTLLASAKKGYTSFGTDISPLMVWVSNVKLRQWDVQKLKGAVKQFKNTETGYMASNGIAFESYMEKAFSHEILLQINYIKKWIRELKENQDVKDFFLMALVGILEEISHIRKHGSHYRFLNKENVGTNKLNISVIDDHADIKDIYIKRLEKMLDDICNTKLSGKGEACCCNIKAGFPQKAEFDIIITSPPYLNRNNYFAQQKAELSVLEMVKDMKDYKELVNRSICSHVDGIMPEIPESVIPEVNTILEKVMRLKSNNAKIPNMIAGYFNDLYDVLKNLFYNSKPGVRMAFVVGNCRWNGVVIPVDHLLCKIGESIGLKPQKIIVARKKGNSPQQMQKYGKIKVRESIVIMEKEN